MESRAVVTSAVDTMLEILPFGQSKANGVALLCKQMGVSLKEVCGRGGGWYLMWEVTFSIYCYLCLPLFKRGLGFSNWNVRIDVMRVRFQNCNFVCTWFGYLGSPPPCLYSKMINGGRPWECITLWLHPCATHTISNLFFFTQIILFFKVYLLKYDKQNLSKNNKNTIFLHLNMDLHR